MIGGCQLEKTPQYAERLTPGITPQKFPTTKSRQLCQFLAIFGSEVRGRLPEPVPTIEDFDSLLHGARQTQSHGPQGFQVGSRTRFPGKSREVVAQDIECALDLQCSMLEGSTILMVTHVA